MREQFLSVLPEDARIAVIERQPKTLEDEGRVANNFLQARSLSISKRGKKPVTSSSRKVKRAPLVSLTIMAEPFRRIAMDIVGPLPRSSTGKRYILVIVRPDTLRPSHYAI